MKMKLRKCFIKLESVQLNVALSFNIIHVGSSGTGKGIIQILEKLLK